MNRSTKRVRPEEDIIAISAAMFQRDICTPPGDDHKSLSKLLKEYDPKLELKFSGRTGTFWVCVHVGNEGHLFPLVDIGYYFSDEEILSDMKDRDLRGRSKHKASIFLAESEAADKERQKKEIENTMPNFGEYLSRLGQLDDHRSQISLAKDMNKEYVRGL